MTESAYDIAILGGGPGGYVAALRAAVKGARVAVVERDRLGGTCVTVGCIPSKALLDSSRAFHTAVHGAEHGITVQGASFDLARAVARKDAVVKQLVGGIEQLFAVRKIALVRGEGTLEGPGRITVRGASGTSRVLARSVIVATGSTVSVPPIAGLAEARPLDSTGALALAKAPARLVVIGAGAIGMELGTFFAEIGTQVTVLEMLPQALAFGDGDLVRIVLRELGRKGVMVHTGARVSAVRRSGAAVTVEAEIGGETKSFEADEVLLGAGRVASLAGVEGAGLAVTRLGITVDQRMRTSVPGIWAIGDCVGDERAPKLAHVASTQAEVAVDDILGEDAAIDYTVIPNVVYTHPELAQVGLTEAQAKERHGDTVKTVRYPFAASGRALALGESAGTLKLVTGPAGRILGVHVAGPLASELVAEAALALRLEATVEDLIATVHAHPTLAEILREACLVAAGTPIHVAR
ncbi:MAG: dihydrolipoyl dehydrogenase [Chloroflexi bacterium]|nr:dihydrolipoyl dehydrogenase [Chloroflexota bacterium]